MATKRIDPPVKGTLFIVPTKDGKFTATLDGQSLGTSKHRDYWDFHRKLQDVKRLNQANILRFAYGFANGRIESVVDAAIIAPKVAKAVRQLKIVASALEPVESVKVVKRVIIDLKD